MASAQNPPPDRWIKPPSVFSFAIDQTNQVEALNNVDFLPIAFRPLNSNPFHLATEGAHGNAISLWKSRAQHGFVSTPKYQVDKLTIRFVSKGKMVRRNRSNNHVGQVDRAMVVAFEEMVNEESSSDFEAISATIDRSTLIACHLALEGEDAGPIPHFVPIVETVNAGMRAFAHNFSLVFNRLRAGLDDGDLTYPLLEEVLIYQFLTTWPSLVDRNATAVPVRPSWQVRRALEYIDANLQRRLTLIEIANAAHTGIRALQMSFRKELGSTPVQWILARRLAGAHNDLASEQDMPIAAIARRWGFAHMGDFSRRYRARYGCTPQETRRNRGRV